MVKGQHQLLLNMKSLHHEFLFNVQVKCGSDTCSRHKIVNRNLAVDCAVRAPSFNSVKLHQTPQCRFLSLLDLTAHTSFR